MKRGGRTRREPLGWGGLRPEVSPWTGAAPLYPLIVKCQSSVVSDSLRPHGLYPVRILCPWDSPGKKTGVRCLAYLQGIFPTQGLNPRLLSLLHG